MKRVTILLAIAILCIQFLPAQQQTRRVLVFSKINRYYHQSIPSGQQAIQELGKELGFVADTTSVADYFNEDSLKKYAAVIFLNTSGNDLLDTSQKADFERYIQAGGGYVGVHGAAATEYGWTWYGRLLGGVFNGHPEPQNGTVHVVNRKHPSTRHLPKKWNRFDEWYNFKNVEPDLNVLMTLDEKTYKGGTHGDYHPIAWYHDFDGGRSFYTALGHTNETYADPKFRKHLAAGITYAMGNNVQLDYSKATTKRVSLPQATLLVFSKTKGWRHSSIPHGKEAMKKIAANKNYVLSFSENAAVFNDDSLKKYNAVIFLSTTGNILDAEQQAAFERYIQAGGGYVGIHSAADTEYDWPWYGNLVGGYFESHPNNPNVRKGTIDVTDKSHPASSMLPDQWTRSDEWYSYKNFYVGIKVLASLDENTFEGGTNGANHPITWYHEFDGGRAFYTGLGHTDESYTEPMFIEHLTGGIEYAIGKNVKLDYSKSYAKPIPDQNRFVKTILTEGLASPMELFVAEDGKIFFTELMGKLSMYDPATKKTKLLHRFAITNKGGTGLIGVTLDPGFAQNRWLYVYYCPGGISEDSMYFNLSRFTLKSDYTPDLHSERIVLQVPVQKNGGSHHGGSFDWDKDGNMYLSTGDGTSPFPSNGYAPLDERPGRDHFNLDAQRSSANTNDLKGKVLRIRPQADGTYTIPDGNLFPKGMANTRPEIYVMGTRNPYRIAVNPRTSAVYWGDIGPDAGEDSLRGPRGYDEFNQAKKPGNFGWPYFVGENRAYPDWDFKTNTAGEKFDPAAPVNNSVNNTGLKTLPPAQPAMIAYPYKASEKYPELGSGGRCAIAGDFYVYNPNSSSPNRFPAHYDGTLFVADWMRNWVFSLRFDSNENYLRNEAFMAANGDFRRPIDMMFGNDGLLYMLEYGSVYGADNEDARLVKIEYFTGNRAPLARAGIVDTMLVDSFNRTRYLTSENRPPTKKEVAGQPPLSVSFSSRGSSDLDDNDSTRVEWLFDGKTVGATSRNAKHVFTKNGIYKTVLRVTDNSGLSATDTVTIKVGNTAPVVKITSASNTSFSPDKKVFRYKVDVKDKEDKPIDPSKVKAFYFYNPQPSKNSNAIDANAFVQMEYPGKQVMANSDCKSCHFENKKAVGPSYVAIANRYKKQSGSLNMLAKKIIDGGGGNWGTQYVMSAHPQLSTREARQIVEYIFSLTDQKKKEIPIPASGELNLRFNDNEPRAQYTIVAKYTDKGGKEVGPLSSTDVINIRRSSVRPIDVDAHPGFGRFGDNLTSGGHKSHLMLKEVDLKGIKKVSFVYTSNSTGVFEVRMDSKGGPVIASVPFGKTSGNNTQTVDAVISEAITGRHDLYFFISRKEKPYDEHASIKEIVVGER